MSSEALDFEEVFPNTWSAIKLIRAKDKRAINSISELSNVPRIIAEEVTNLIQKKEIDSDFYIDWLKNIASHNNPEIADWLLDNDVFKYVENVDAERGIWNPPMSMSSLFQEREDGYYGYNNLLSTAIEQQVATKNISLRDSFFWTTLCENKEELGTSYYVYLINPHLIIS